MTEPKKAAAVAEAKNSEDPMEMLANALAAMLERNGEALAGRVHLVGLAEVKAKMGKKWPGCRKHVYTIVENIISRHAGSGDTFERYGEEQYLLIFANREMEDSQGKLVTISKEIYKHFLGDDELEQIKVTTALAHVDGTVQMESVTLARIIESLAQVAATHEVSPDGVTVQPDQEVQATLSEHGVLELESVPAPTAELPTPLVSVFEDQDMESRRQRMQSRFANFKATNLEFLFQPVWDLRHQMISTYRVVSVCTLENGARMMGYDIDLPDYGRGNTARLDLDQLEHGMDIFGECYTNNFRFFCIFPVHFNTLATLTSRTDFCSICEIIPAPLRSHVIFEIIGSPVGVPVGRLSEVSQSIRPYCHFLFCRVQPGFKSFGSFHEIGIQAVSMEFQFQSEPVARRIETIQRFVNAAKIAGLSTYVLGADDLQTTVAADKAGASLLSGGAIEGMTAFPEASHRFTRKDFMEQIS